MEQGQEESQSWASADACCSALCSGLERMENLRQSMEESLSGLTQVQADIMAGLASLQGENPVQHWHSRATKLRMLDTSLDNACVEGTGDGDRCSVRSEDGGIGRSQTFTVESGLRSTFLCHTRRGDDSGALKDAPERKGKSVKKISARELRERPIIIHEAFEQLRDSEQSHGQDARVNSSLLERELQRAMTRNHITGYGLSSADLSNEDMKRSRWVMNPHGPVRLMLDLVSMVFLFYDLCVIPVVLAWDIELRGWILTTAWASLGFWTIDLFASFRTSIYLRGTLVTSPRVIASHYLQTRFLPDFVVVCADWTSTLLQLVSSAEVGPHVKMVRFVKVGRALRLAGIMKVRRFSEIMERLLEGRSQVYMELGPAVVKIFFFLIWTNHVISCAWYALGSLISAEDTDTGLRWTDTYLGPDTELTYLSFSVYAYFSAFHWSLCQMTPGSLQIHSVNTGERIFSVLCLLVGMVFFSSLISSISAKLTEVRLSKEQNTKMMNTLRHYLTQNNVDPVVVTAVQKQLSARNSHRPPIVAKDVSALALLSTHLQAAVFREVFAPHLVRCPLWRWCSEFVPVLFQTLCHKAVESLILKPHDMLFSAGTPVKHAYVVASSKPMLQFTQLPETYDDEPTVTYVKSGAWLSQAALWVKWVTTGSVESLKACELVAISADMMVECLRENGVVYRVLADYARAFHAACEFAASKPLCGSVNANVLSIRPTDLDVPGTSFQDLLPSMSAQSRRIIGLVAVDVLRNNGFRSLLVSSKAVSRLEEEVCSGKCLLMLDGSGEVERNINVVALRIESESDGMLLVQLGTWDVTSSKALPSPLLPGTKQRPGESVTDTAERILSNALSPLADWITLSDFEVQIERQISRRTGVITLYKRSVYDGTISVPCEPLGLATVRMQGFEEHSPRHVMRDVCLLTDGCSLAVYAWVQPAFFEQCKSSERVLLPYLNALRVTDEDAQRARERLSISAEHPGPCRSLERHGNAFAI